MLLGYPVVRLAHPFQQTFFVVLRIFSAILNTLARVIYVINANGTFVHQPGSINLKVNKMTSVKSTVLFEFGK